MTIALLAATVLKAAALLQHAQQAHIALQGLSMQLSTSAQVARTTTLRELITAQLACSVLQTHIVLHLVLLRLVDLAQGTPVMDTSMATVAALVQSLPHLQAGSVALATTARQV